MHASVPALLALGSAVAGCGSTTIVHRTLTSSEGTRETTGYGLGSTTNDSSSIGRQSHDEDRRVEHAADLSRDGRDRFWRVALHAKDTGDVIRMEWLELCAGNIERPFSCRTAVEALPDGKQFDVGGFLGPALVDPNGLGRARRASSVSSSTGTFTEVSGSAGDPGSTPATPAFGVWFLTAGTGSVSTVFGGGLLVTGGLLYCHAPSLAAPRCYTVQPAPQTAGLAEVVATQVLRRGSAYRHVLWGVAIPRADAGLPAHGAIVRCEADDETANPSCRLAEIHP